MSQETDKEVEIAELQAEKPSEEGWEEVVEEAPEEKKQNWPAVLVGVIVAVLIACSGVVCAVAGITLFTGGKKASVTGTITYRERMALPPDAVVNVQIQDVSLADAPATVIGEKNINNPGQVPIPYEVEYNTKDIDDRHTYVVRAEIRDGNGNLLFTTAQSYGVITQGNPTQDVQIVVELVGIPPQPPPETTPTPTPIAAYIQIDEPVYGATVPIDQPFTARGSGAGLPEGNVVVEVIDRDGNVLDRQPATLQGENVGAGGAGTWEVQLQFKSEPGIAGKIYAYSLSPLDNSIIAEASVEVSLGKTEPKPTFLDIQEPPEGSIVDNTNPIQVSGVGGGLPEGNVVVRALDDNDTILAEQATTLQGSDVGAGGAGTWSVQLIVGAPPGTAGRIVAFSPSPLTGEDVASAVVHVVYGTSEGGELEGTTWVLGNTLPDTEITALFEDGEVNGSAGCNNYFGGYTLGSKNSIQIGTLGSTMMMCEQELMNQEQTFLSALQEATEYQVEENVLTLYYPGGALVFQGQTSP
jgi:uncharacterized lipoprotein YbaY